MKLIARDDSKPGATAVNRAKLLNSSAAPTASVIATATSATIKTAPARPGDAAEYAPIPSFIAACDDRRSARTAGASAGSAPASIATSTVNASTGPSTVVSSSRGTSAGPNATTRRTAPYASARPQAPPIVERTRFSVSHCITTRVAAGADRQADRGFASSRRGAREQEVGDIRARDEQHEADRACEQEERRLRVADHRLVRRRETHAPAMVRVGIRRIEPGAHGIDLRLRRANGRAGLQSPDGHHEPAVARHAAHVVFDGGPQLDVIGREAKPRRHHADDDVRAAFHHDRAADDAAIAREQPLPDAIPEHDDFVATRAIVGGFDHAAEQRRRAEQRKQRAADARAVDALGQVEAGEVERPPGEQSEAVERRQIPAPVLEIRKGAAGDRAGRAGSAVEKRENAGRIADTAAAATRPRARR